MTRGVFSRLFASSIAFLLAMSWAGTASAADPPPAPTVAGPAMVVAPEALPSYPTPGTVGCETCGRGHLSRSHRSKIIITPRATCLCPGACFGYFPTQWSRWEAVCPIPYPGAGLTDAPPRPAPPPPVLPAPAPKETKKGSDTPLPKKDTPATAPVPTPLPAIPLLPSKSSKF